jgi:hypothetical protein
MAETALRVFVNNELAKRNALSRTRVPGADLVRMTCALCMPEAMKPYLGASDELGALLMCWGHDPELVKACLTMTPERRRLAATLDPDVVARLTLPWTGRGAPPVLSVLMCGDLSAIAPDKLKAIVPGEPWLVTALAKGGHLLTVTKEWIATNIEGELERVQALLAGKYVEQNRVSPQWVIDHVQDDRDRIVLLSRFRAGEVTMQHLLSCFDDFEDFVDAATACGLGLDTRQMLATWDQHYSRAPSELSRGLVLFNNRHGNAEYDARALVDAMEGGEAHAVYDIIESAGEMIGVEELARPYVAQDGSDMTPLVVERALMDALSSKGWSHNDSMCIVDVMLSVA